MSELKLSFRSATDFDIQRIYLWLLEQERREVHGSFLCNWNLTQQFHDENQLFIATIDDEPIAYTWEDFGILEVREEFRSKGVGKQLVEYAMECAISNGRCAVSIECKPESSIPFWKKMGFEFYNENEASFVFEKSFDMPINGSPINVDIIFYPEQVKWILETPPIKSFSPPAMLDNQDTIHLQHRVWANVGNEDAMIRICVDGGDIYFDKARHSEAVTIGVSHDSSVCYVDKLHNKAWHWTNR